MDHVTDFLGAYLDGEIRSSQVDRIEKHLETCALCRHELAELTVLRHLLQSTASAPTLKSEDQFVADVGLLLQRQPESPALERMLTTGWKAIPVGLATTWIFVQTSLIIMTCVYLVSLVAPGTAGIDQILSVPTPSAWSNALGWIAQPLMIQILEIVTQLLRQDMHIYWHISVFLVVPFVIGILFLCWLASWWVVSERSSTAESA